VFSRDDDSVDKTASIIKIGKSFNSKYIKEKKEFGIS
jgi:hypothetical protein